MNQWMGYEAGELVSYDVSENETQYLILPLTQKSYILCWHL